MFIAARLYGEKPANNVALFNKYTSRSVHPIDISWLNQRKTRRQALAVEADCVERLKVARS